MNSFSVCYSLLHTRSRPLPNIPQPSTITSSSNEPSDPYKPTKHRLTRQTATPTQRISHLPKPTHTNISSSRNHLIQTPNPPTKIQTRTHTKLAKVEMCRQMAEEDLTLLWQTMRIQTRTGEERNSYERQNEHSRIERHRYASYPDRLESVDA